MLIFSGLIILLSYLYIWRPFSAYNQKRIEEEFLEKYKAFKLITVRRYYKSLKKLSFEEIQEKYNVDHIYEMIGRI